MADTSEASSTVYMYTCITCHVAFENSDIQRAHYKSDWHRYNLKRKVVELPPVSAENFQERVLAQRKADALQLEEKQSQYCTICHKHFASDKSFESHLRSRKHKDIVEKQNKKASIKNSLEESVEKNATSEITPLGSQISEETTNTTKYDQEEEEEEQEPLEVNECLFCPHYEEDLEANLDHMSRCHGFFIPDLEYLVDLKGLIEYLCEKVGVAKMCLYCNEKGKMFYSVESVQHHMIDKSHCKLFFEGDSALEYAEFYDYTTSYPDHKDGFSPDEEINPADSTLKINEDLELVLPSGVTLGHRYLKHYYKQHLPSYEHRKATLIGHVMAKYRAIGWKGSLDETRRERDKAWALRMKQQREMKLGVKANKLQRHFRPQVIF